MQREWNRLTHRNERTVRARGVVLAALGLACSLGGWSAVAAEVPAPRPAVVQPAPSVQGFALFASGGIANCSYTCRNTTTGQVTFHSASTSEAECCGGQGVSCPTGTVFAGAFAWNNKFIEC